MRGFVFLGALLTVGISTTVASADTPMDKMRQRGDTVDRYERGVRNFDFRHVEQRTHTAAAREPVNLDRRRPVGELVDRYEKHQPQKVESTEKKEDDKKAEKSPMQTPLEKLGNCSHGEEHCSTGATHVVRDDADDKKDSSERKLSAGEDAKARHVMNKVMLNVCRRFQLACEELSHDDK